MDSKLSFTNAKSVEMGQADRTISEGNGVEVGGVAATSTIKRDLRRRHINMIAIAGMIVSGVQRLHLTLYIFVLTHGRGRVSS